MNELVIEKGIPLPKRSGALTSGLRKLQIGDSFLTDKLVPAFSVTAKRIGIKIASRKQPDGQMRIWRVA